MFSLAIISLMCYIIIELLRYVRYIKLYRKLSDVKQTRDMNHNNVKSFFKSFDGKNISLFGDNIGDMYNNQVRLCDIKYSDACESLYDMLGRNDIYIDKIKQHTKNYQIYMKRNKNVDVLTGKYLYNRIKWGRDKLKSWFMVLPIYLITKCYAYIIHMYMIHILGYECYGCKNGMLIWHNGYDKKRGRPIIYLHASVGGISIMVSMIRHFRNKHNIILPEIPGLSFIETNNAPPTVTQIADDIHSFIITQYNIINNNDNGTIMNDNTFTTCDNESCETIYSERDDESYIKEDGNVLDGEDKFMIDVMGHSLGNNIACGIINRYPGMINNFYCVEGYIFPHGALNSYRYFNYDLCELPRHTWLMTPLMYRNLWVQYFVKRNITLDECFLYNLNGRRYRHINIYMFHIQNDYLFRIDKQLTYARLNRYNINYKIFNGEYGHGSFITSPKIRNNIIADIEHIHNVIS